MFHVKHAAPGEDICAWSRCLLQAQRGIVADDDSSGGLEGAGAEEPIATLAE